MRKRFSTCLFLRLQCSSIGIWTDRKRQDLHNGDLNNIDTRLKLARHNTTRNKIDIHPNLITQTTNKNNNKSFLHLNLQLTNNRSAQPINAHANEHIINSTKTFNIKIIKQYPINKIRKRWIN